MLIFVSTKCGTNRVSTEVVPHQATVRNLSVEHRQLVAQNMASHDGQRSLVMAINEVYSQVA